MTRSHTIKTTPKGWTRTAIAQIALVTQGQSPPSSSYNREKRGLPFFQGKANFGLRHPVPEVWCDKPHKIAKKGDILISVRAPVGPVNICREDCGIGRGLASIRPSPKINSIYVYYHLLFLENDIAARGTGTTFKAITGDQLRSVVLNIAPPNEQAYITSRIESLFSKIDATRQSLEAAMSLLEQNRLSILNHAFTGRLVRHKFNSQLNYLKGWTRTAIAQIALVTQGQSPPSSSYNREKRGLPFFQGKANFGLRHPVPEVWCDKPHKIAKKGDILISVRAPVGPVNICREDCGIGRGLASIRPSPKINSIYVYYHLLFLENDIAARGTGTTFKAITGDQLRSVVLNIAPPNEQAYITSRIESLFSKIDATRQSLEAAMSLLEQNRLSILNHAFTGRLVRHKPNS